MVVGNKTPQEIIRDELAENGEYGLEYEGVKIALVLGEDGHVTLSVVDHPAEDYVDTVTEDFDSELLLNKVIKMVTEVKIWEAEFGSGDSS